MKVHYYTDLVEGGLTIKRDVLFDENALNEVVRYLICQVLLFHKHFCHFWIVH